MQKEDGQLLAPYISKIVIQPYGVKGYMGFFIQQQVKKTLIIL